MLTVAAEPPPDGALDIERPEALIAYLRSRGHIGADENPVVRVLPGGVSNRTVWVARPGGEDWVLKQALAKLRVAVDWFSGPDRILREALGIRYLATLAPPGSTVPLVFEDAAQHLLAMRAVPQPHENFKAVLLEGRVEERHVRALGELAGTVHRRAFERRAELARVFDDRSFFESLRLEAYYGFAAERTPVAAPFLTALIDETRATRFTLVHGDFSPKNVLVYADRLVLLDHEVIHFGDGAFDVGFALAHLLSKAHHLPRLRHVFADAAVLFWRAYADAAGIDGWPGFEARAARHGLGCLLARVDGRSPLEYLDDTERTRQRGAVLKILTGPGVPASIEALAKRFLECL